MRRREESTGGNGKSKMTVMMFQLEGGDETLREGIRTISQAMGNVLNPTRLMLAKPAPTLTPPEAAEASDGQPELDLAPESGEEEARSSQRPSRPAKSRSPIILTLDLKAGKVPLTTFCETKGVGDNDNRRYLAIAYWLKENLSIAAITMDHVHTCYRFLGWQTPADASSPLRRMKNSGWFDKGTEKGAYAINHVGENEVMRMGNGNGK
jgi:hypothetical protein